MNNVPQLSTQWFRLRVAPEALAWWRKHRRELPPQDEYPPRLQFDQQASRKAGARVQRRQAPGSFAWFPTIEGKRVPCIAFVTDESEHDLDATTAGVEAVAPTTLPTAEMGKSGAFEESDGYEWYDLDEAYEAARVKRDASLSPHTAFRTLERGDYLGAVGFLQRFGPLEPKKFSLEPGDPVLFDFATKSHWLNLNVFWARHRRFVAIA